MAIADDPPSEVLLVPSNAATSSMEGPPGKISQNVKYTRQGNPDLARLTGREKEFEELGDLTALYEGLSAKTRQHVNPLADHFQIPSPPPVWEELFDDPSLPLQVDVGCGSGRFVLIRAQRLAGHPAVEIATEEELDDMPDDHIPVVTDKARANVLGMEIRQKLVERAQAWAKRLALRNCTFMFTNATVSWGSILRSYPGPIELVTMQFPDPHFKVRHHKRRHVQPQLVKEMAETLKPGARVFLQGDVPEAVRWMRDKIEAYGGGGFDLAPECRNNRDLVRDEWETLGDAAAPQGAQLPLTWSADATAGWLSENPLGVPSEREVYVAQIKASVYRVMLVRI